MIKLFVRHKVAANLMMFLMLLSGVAAMSMLNRQFLPSFSIDWMSVIVPWQGASAEDVESSVNEILEDRLSGIQNVRLINSVAQEGMGSVWIQFEEGTNMDRALDDVAREVDQVRNLPEAAEEPVITVLEANNTELIAKLVVSTDDERELRPIVRKMERELSRMGITKVMVEGLPLRELAIQVPPAVLQELGMSIDQLALMVRQRSQDVPAGSIGRNDSARQLRGVQQQRGELGFSQLPVITDERGRLLLLSDIADIEQRVRTGGITLERNGKATAELVLYRSKTQDLMEVADKLNKWVADKRITLPPTVNFEIYDQRWTLLDDRINLLLFNGITGLALIIIILFIFLNGRVAFWVTMGIPISFAATLFVLALFGGTINMISLFAMIMALGIIVDDAIVVGEDTLTHFQNGEPPLQAAEGGALRMYWPVMSAMLTTAATFLPLMLVGGYVGAVLFDIPLIIICVVIASLLECFLVLPGHLHHTLKKVSREPSKFRKTVDGAFDWFKDKPFRTFVTYAIKFRFITFAAAIGSFMFAMALITSGKVKLTFFPTPESPIMIANMNFLAGTSRDDMRQYVASLEKALYETDAHFLAKETKSVDKLVNIHVVNYGKGIQPGTNFTRSGENYAHMMVELKSADSRDVRNGAFIEEWKSRIPPFASLEALTVTEPKGGPPGREVEVHLRGLPLDQLKAAAGELVDALKKLDGVYGVEDDTPYGQEQLIYALKPYGRSLGLSVTDVGRQLRSAYDGQLIQIYQDTGAEVEVRMMLPDADRDSLGSLPDFPIVLPTGRTVALQDIVDINPERGFQRLRHSDGELTVKVGASIDPLVANAGEVNQQIAAELMPDLEAKYGFSFKLAGQQEEQARTFDDMIKGVMIAFVLMYIILAWVFGSYSWPLIVMSIIPIGLVGAVLGHWVLGIDLTMLSFFGFFGLSGIVVNDSIILVVFYRQLKESMDREYTIMEALIEAPCQRLRAVMLTSLTTVAGLIPLLFETSLQAQFLIPMAASIAFGLMFATLLVLILVPALLSVSETILAKPVKK